MTRTTIGHRRRRLDRDPGNVIFGTIGWLFADLMLALALAFIVATTVGQPSPPGHPTPPPPKQTTTTAPTTTLATNEPPLERDPIVLSLNVDWQGLLNDDPGVAQSVRDQVQANPSLTGRRVGMVFTFGGTNGRQDTSRGLAIAAKVNAILSGLGVFQTAVYQKYISYAPPSVLGIDVYVYKY